MSLNPWLHPRNPYRQRPDFGQLARGSADFRQVVQLDLQGHVKMDFTDRAAVAVLTRTLLKKDFGLDVSWPEGSLVPTLPLRFNYLLWIEDLLRANPDLSTRPVLGFDVGVGASCIYPLLAVKHLQWKMIGSELNQVNLDYAQKNVAANGLDGHIRLVRQSEDEGTNLFGSLLHAGQRIAFTLCNPPFYEESDSTTTTTSRRSAKASAAAAERFPTPAGRPHELSTEGGEVAFIGRLVADSAASDLRQVVLIFTCMIGHKSSRQAVKRLLVERQKSHDSDLRFTFTEFCQGKTMRWGVAWTFHESVELVDLAPMKQQQEKRKLHAPVSLPITLIGPEEPALDCETVLRRLTDWLADIDVHVKPGKVEEDRATFTLKTVERNWKNQRRKRREQKRREEELARQERASEEPPPSKRLRPAGRSDDDSDAMSAGGNCSSSPTTGSDKQAHQSEEGMKKPTQLCCKVFLNREDDHVMCDAVYIDGEAGKEGLFQLLQFIKNKTKGIMAEDGPKENYVLNTILPIEEDSTHELKGHRAFCIEELNPNYGSWSTGTWRPSRKNISRYVCGMLNSGKGGTIYCGVLDNGMVGGIPLNTYQKDHFHLSLRDTLDRFQPRVPPHLVELKYVDVVAFEHQRYDVVPGDSEPVDEQLKQLRRYATTKPMTDREKEVTAMESMNYQRSKLQPAN